MNSRESNEETDAAIAELIGWTLIDRRAKGWGEGPLVWKTGDAETPTRQWFSPSTETIDARMAGRKLGRTFPARMTAAAICAALLEEKT